MISYIKLLLAKKLFKNNFKTNELKNLTEDGIIVKNNFLTKEECNKLLIQGKEILRDESKFKISKYDSRIFGFENRFHNKNDLSILEKINLLSNSTIDKLTYLKERKYSYMYNQTEYSDLNLGSGGDWHRDSAFSPNFKIITYLTDVNTKNGPFQYIKGSHKIKCYKKLRQLGVPIQTTRFTNNNILSYFSSEDIIECNGGLGTTIVAITNGIHRGKPVEANGRKAITRYNFYRSIPSKIYQEITK